MRYIGTHMHLHSCYEVLGSMHGHCMQARKYGLEAVWFTDHDSFMGARRALNGYDFEAGLKITESRVSVEAELKKWMQVMNSLGETPDQALWRQVLEQTAEPPASTGFQPLESNIPDRGCVELYTSDAYVGTQCMRMEVLSEGSEWAQIGAEFVGWKKRMNRSLLAEVTLGLAFRLNCPPGDNCRVIIEFAFSQQPPDLHVDRLIYCAGNMDGLDRSAAAILPLRLTGDGIWQYAILPLSNDAETHTSGGLDNAFQNLTIRIEARRGAVFSLLVDYLNIWEKYHLQELMLRQRELGAEIGDTFGVKAYVTTEISMAGHHKNCFSPAVPIMDYPAQNYHITHQDAVLYLKAHNAIYAFNHPFFEYRNLPLTGAQREKIAAFESERLIRANCYDAHLLEVAFPEGRYGFPLTHFLKLWDQMGMHGIFITGYGDSDNHRCDQNWADGNNFAAYIAAPQISADALCLGMLQGNLYSADPAQTARLESFEVLNAPEQCMGCVIYTNTAQTLQVSLTGCKKNMELRWVDDGYVTDCVKLEHAKSRYDHRYKISGRYGLCRIEIFDQSGRCLLVSNPIYFTDHRLKMNSKRNYFERIY